MAMGSTAAAVTALVAPLLLPPGVQRGSKAAEIFLGSHHHHTGHTIFIMGKKFVKFFIKKSNYAASFTKFFIFINFVKLQNELIEDSLEIS